MSRTFSLVVLGMALWYLGASTVLAADKTPVKKPPPKKPPAVADDPFAPAGHKAAKAKLVLKGRSQPLAVQSLPSGGNEALIERALDMPTQMQFTDSPLTDVVDYLVDYHSQKLGHRFEIRLDNKALSDAGIAKDTAVTMNMRGISLRSATRFNAPRTRG